MFLLLSIIVAITISLAKYAVSVESFTFCAGHRPRVFTALTKPILLLCQCKGFCIVVYLDDVLVLVHSNWVGKRA